MNILTFDIEDWFHIEFEDDINKWTSRESRLEANVERIFQILESTNQKATFFCLGWVADHFPEVLKRIDRLGYEIGSHSYDHKLVYNKTPKEFEEDLKRSIKVIENCIGKKVKYFRAPAFSVNQSTLWYFEILHKNGIEIDASIFPNNRDYGGFPGFSPARPVIVNFKGIDIKELPINTANFFGKKVVFSGGGYFRLLPYSVIRYLARSSTYMMTYLHPRDLDKDQPLLEGLSLTRRFKSYVGLSSSLKKFERFLNDFDFIDIAQANTMINWNNVDRIRV